MHDVYYTKEVNCPICMTRFTTTKIKSSALRIDHRDEDFCIHYIEHNPIYYEIFVCPKCGYASTENFFDKLSEKNIITLSKAFEGRKVERDFCGIRSYVDAIDSFKIAIYTANLIDSKNTYLGGLALKTAWLYRYSKDEKEKNFLEMALNHYIEAYDKENFPVNNLDELTVIYLIGVLYKRLGMYKESVNWLSKIQSHPDKNSNKRILKMSKEQWYAVREIMKKNINEYN